MLRNNQRKSNLKGGQHPPEWQVHFFFFCSEISPVLGGQLAPDYPMIAMNLLIVCFAFDFNNKFNSSFDFS
jgi:hypothetical protein